MSESQVSRKAVAILTVIGLALVAIATVYTLHVVHRSARQEPSTPPASAPTADIFDGTPQLVFRNTALGPGYGHVASVPLGDPGGDRAFTPLSCDRVYAAAGTILCLASDRGVVTTYRAVVYDKDLNATHSVSVAGLPSRARLSADGRMASWTVFVYGDSYVSGGFSTRTSILDTRTGQIVANLELFSVTKDGKPYQSVDINFWGVTFAADDNTFYATMATKGETYLVRGDLAAETVTTLRTNVECPSLSPDGTRLVFKKRVSDNQLKPWRLAMLDLSTMKETMLAETNSVDDQAAWLDNYTVMYALPEAKNAAITDVWKVPADGSRSPQLVVAGAFSPAAVTG